MGRGIAVMVAFGIAPTSCATVTAPSRVQIPVAVAQEGGWVEVDGQRHETPAVVTVSAPRKPTVLLAGAPGHATASMVLSPEFRWRALFLLFPVGLAIDWATKSAWIMPEDPIEIDIGRATWTRRGRRSEEAYPARWVASVSAGFPSTGLGLGRRFGDWRLHGSFGAMPTPPVLMLGGMLELSRGYRLGPVTLSPALAAGGMVSDHCGYDGCGQPFWFSGIGPQLGIEYWHPAGPVHLVIGASGGLFVAVERSPNMHPIQPQVTLLRFGVGW